LKATNTDTDIRKYLIGRTPFFEEKLVSLKILKTVQQS